VALIIAVAAGAAAAYAVKTARDVQNSTAGSPSSSTPATSLPVMSTPPAAASASATASPTPTQTTPAVQFVPDFQRAAVNVPVPAASSCSDSYVDVDTLAVGDGAATGHEFYLATCGSPLRIFIDRTSGRAVSTTADPSPAACYARVTGTPTSELQVTGEQGLTFCLLTNKAQATAQSLPQRLAIVSVGSLSATTAQLVVSTYQIVG
jgi:hypothetical protein